MNDPHDQSDWADVSEYTAKQVERERMRREMKALIDRRAQRHRRVLTEVFVVGGVGALLVTALAIIIF